MKYTLSIFIIVYLLLSSCGQEIIKSETIELTVEDVMTEEDFMTEEDLSKDYTMLMLNLIGRTYSLSSTILEHYDNDFKNDDEHQIIFEKMKTLCLKEKADSKIITYFDEINSIYQEFAKNREKYLGPKKKTTSREKYFTVKDKCESYEILVLRGLPYHKK